MSRLNLVVLRCRDIEPARSFYELLGMRFTKHAHGPGPQHYAHEDEAGVLELYPLGDAAAGGPEMTGLGFAASALDDLHARMTAAGHAPGPVRAQPWGTTFVVRDPDGRRVELKQTPT